MSKNIKHKTVNSVLKSLAKLYLGGVQLKKIRIRISNFRGAFVFFRIFS